MQQEQSNKHSHLADPGAPGKRMLCGTKTNGRGMAQGGSLLAWHKGPFPAPPAAIWTQPDQAQILGTAGA